MKAIFFITFRKLTIIIFLFSAAAVHAQVVSLASGNWSSAGTWSPAGVPGGGDNVTVDGAIGLNKSLSTASGISGSLTINPGKSLITSNDKDVSIKNEGTLVVSGTLDVYNLDFSAGSHIYIASGGQVIVRHNFSNNNNSLDVIIDGTLTIYGDAYNGNGAVISGAGNINTLGGAFTGSGTVASTVSLPVTLVSFTAVKENDRVAVKWITASEFDNDYFTLERSNDGIEFFSIGTVKGAGNSVVLNEYYFEDEQFPNTVYYRLKQTDVNGSSAYYGGVISIRAGRSEMVATTYPNPVVNGQFHVKFETGPDSVTTDVILTDMSGNVVYSVSTNDTQTHLTIPQVILKPGVYTLVIKTGHEEISKRLVVK